MNRQAALEELGRCWMEKDARSLCSYYFNVDLTPLQSEIVRCTAFDEYPRTVVSCMTRYGKSWSISMGALLWILRNEDKKLAIIAPTMEKTAIIRNYIAGFAVESSVFSQLLDLDKTGIARIRKEVSRKRMTWKNGTEMRTLSAEGQGAQLMGFGAHKLIVDEECDIKFEVYRSKIMRMLGESEDSTYIGIGNPWHRDNQMWQHWLDPNWHKIHIGWKEALAEGRISEVFLQELRETLSAREFEVLYDADFPETSEDALIDWKWIEHAYRGKVELQPNAKIEVVAGVDVAEQGNDLTVVTIGVKDLTLNRYHIRKILSWGKTDLMPTVGKILPLIRENKVECIRIDATGVGSGVYSRLEELKNAGKITCKVEAFQGGQSPSNDEAKERFLNAKAESYWHLRCLFEAGKVFIPKHSVLISQLSKMKWEHTSSEKIRVRDPGSKEKDTAEEKSPDFSDSLNIMCWSGGRAPLVFGKLDVVQPKAKKKEKKEQPLNNKVTGK